MSWHVQIQVCGLKTSLTQAEKNHGCLGKRRARRREVELGLGPPQPVLVEPGQDVVPAQGLGMGHQLLLGERAVEDVQDLRGEDGGSTQDFHVLLARGGGGRGSGSRERLTFGSALSVLYPRGIRFNGQHRGASVERGESFPD